MSRFKKLKLRIKKNEGYCNQIYFDQLNHKTIGYGHLIKENEKFLPNKNYSNKYLTALFENDFKKALNDFTKNHDINHMPNNIQEVLIEMIFQLGITKFLDFKKFNKHIKKKKLYLAALEMLDSLWYHQTPKRVEVLIKVLLQLKR